MTTLLFSNNAQTVLASAITSTALTANLSPGSGVLFPSPQAGQGFYMTFVDAATGLLTEIVLVTSVVGDTITMVRAQDGTTAKPWLAGDIAGAFMTAGTARQMVQSDQLQNGTYVNAVASGTVNAINLSLPSNLTSIPPNFQITFTALGANTGGVTIALTLGGTALSAVPLVKYSNQPLTGGEIPTVGVPVHAIYSSVFNAFVLQNAAGGSGGTIITPSMVSASPAFDSGSGTSGDPYIITPSSISSGATNVLISTITVVGLFPYENIALADLNNAANGGRYSFSNNVANSSGTCVFSILFNDIPPSSPTTTYTLALKIGASSVYVGYVGSIVTGITVDTPSITSPTNGASGISLTPTITGSAFATTGGSDTQQAADWQISTNNTFTALVVSDLGDTVNLTSYTVSSGVLSNSTTYYVRCRYKGTIAGYSSFSSTVSFTTLAATVVIATPSITSPANGATGVSLTPTLTSSAFATTLGSDTQASSDWQIATDSGFTGLVVNDIADSVNLTSYTVSPATLVNGTIYYARVRYRGVSGAISSYSSTISFTTLPAVTIATPSIISPTAAQTNFNPTGPFTSSAFSVSGGTDTHASSDWQVANDSGFTSLVINDTLDATNLVSYSPSPGALANATTYYVRVRYHGASGAVSSYSTGVQFTTASPHGVTWTAQTSGTTESLSAISWNGSSYCAVGGATGSKVITSADSITWTSHTLGMRGYAIAWNGTLFCAVGQNGNIATSPTGSTWTSRSGVGSNDLNGIAWNGAKFCAVGLAGTILTSPDGITWTSQTSGISNALKAIAWDGAQFCAVGNSGKILTSPDGITWTSRTSGTTNALNGIIWNGTIFCVVGESPIVLTSPDGITWTTRSSGAPVAFNAVGWSGSLLCAVGNTSGGAGEIYTSPDGTTWTSRNSHVNNALYGIVYGSLLVVVGANGTVITS